MTRVVVDANVLASGIAGHPDSPSRRLIEALTADRIEAVLCDRILRPRDDYLVALARATRVDAIITGDRDLLDHEGLEPPALTPRAACERFGLS
jgi:predicted nucleic acid-binding protein